jgi:hypothetical protein
MTTTNVSTASQEAPLVLPVAPLATQELPLATEALKDAIIALIKEKNPELRRLLRAEVFFLRPPKRVRQPKKIIVPVQEKRISYDEMPFWKANPDLKPMDLKSKGYGVTQEALKKAQAFFQEPGNEITDEWFKMLD